MFTNTLLDDNDKLDSYNINTSLFPGSALLPRTPADN